MESGTLSRPNDGLEAFWGNIMGYVDFPTRKTPKASQFMDPITSKILVSLLSASP